MPKDEIIVEVWRNREAYVAQHQHDLKKIVADLRRRQQERSAKVVDRRGRKRQ